MRFDGPGERLEGAYIGRDLAGVGGLTLEPTVLGALRVRRFYVRAAWRRAGVGRLLARSLVLRASNIAELLTVNAQAPSFPFWESIGFMPLAAEGLTHTHVRTFPPRGPLAPS
jgi:GNAT superfamily N-acetyltransferase